MTLTLEQQRRVRDLFEAGIDHDRSRHPQWLYGADPDDGDVRAEVRSLIDHHSRAGEFLTRPVAETAPHLLDEEQPLPAGTVLGTYTIVRELGRGGMGR